MRSPNDSNRYWLKPNIPVLILIMILTYITVNGQQDTNSGFMLRQTESSFVVHDLKADKMIIIPRKWFEWEEGEYFPEEPLSDRVETMVPFFHINRSLTALIVSDFTMAGKFSSGRDLFIIYRRGDPSVKRFSVSDEAGFIDSQVEVINTENR